MANGTIHALNNPESWKTNGDLQYRKCGNLVEISCRVNSKSDGYLLGTLPQGYRPANYILIANSLNPDYTRAQIDFQTGKVLFQNGTGSAVNVRIHEMFFAN